MQKFTQAYHNMKNKHLTTNRQVASQRTKKKLSKDLEEKKSLHPLTQSITHSKNLDTHSMEIGNSEKFLNSIF